MSIASLLQRIERINEHSTIQEIIVHEPTFQQILDLAANPLPEENRWLMYESLKRRALSLVGWYARCPHLKTSKHYDAMIWAIDLLLPASGEQVTDVSPYTDEWQQVVSEFENRGKGEGMVSFEWHSFRELLEEIEAHNEVSGSDDPGEGTEQWA